MQRSACLKQVLTTTGAVLGGYATAGRAQVYVRGWILNNKAGTAGAVVNFREPASPAANSGGEPALPAIGDGIVFSIPVAAGGSAFFFDETGILFKEGCFVEFVNDAGGALQGVALYS